MIMYTVEYEDGTKVWYLNGKLHREDGPAVESTDGSKAWYLHGERHREADYKIAIENLNKEKTSR
jgi:hypothetical protein